MGLITDELTKGGAPAEEAPAQEAPAAEVEARGGNEMQQGPIAQEEPTPEEQANYEKVVLAGLKILHDDATADKFVSMLKSRAEAPAEAIADIAVMLIQQIDEKSKGTLPAVVILPAAIELLGEVVTIAKAAKAFEADQAVLAQAAQLTIAGLAQAYGVSREEVEEFMGSIDMEAVKGAMQGAGTPAGNTPAGNAPAAEAAPEEEITPEEAEDEEELV